MNSKKLLIIQTAFIGDVILASSLIEYIKKSYPELTIDFLLRHGNESIIETNPSINHVWIWDKRHSKFKSLFKLISQVRKEKYDYVINIQRFFNSGLLTVLAGAKTTIGFHSNPLSLFFKLKITHKIPHLINGTSLHEVQRNALLAQHMFPEIKEVPLSQLKCSIYFNQEDKKKIEELNLKTPYFVIAPASVWYTKQWHLSKWKELILELKKRGTVILIGAPTDLEFTQQITRDEDVMNLCGRLTLRQSALLIKSAKRFFANDSAPLHLASAVNANTTAIFCSTVPEFGYFPLSDNNKLIQLTPRLECMPCGLHGHNSCPKGHFKCAMDINTQTVIDTID
jgi:lipopolysaccharide heptosyltransferase II